MPYAWRVAIPLVGRPDDATKVDCGGQGKHGDPGPDGVHVPAENHAEDNCNDQKHDGLARQILVGSRRVLVVGFTFIPPI